jgi:hypothetical protein
MNARRTAAKSAAAPLHDSSTASRRIATQTLEEFRYLAPSMNMTMTASLPHTRQLHPIDAFRASLATPGASMREPSNAIAAGRSVDGTD